MAKEQEFHDWIEDQDKEEKERVWQMILQKEAERGLPPIPPKPAPKKSFSWKRWAPVMATAAAAITITTVCLAVFLPAETPDDEGIRFFTSEDYTSVETDNVTVQEFAEESGKNFLYFDWYDGSEATFTYQLKDGGETVGYQEKLMDPEMGYMVELYITDNKTKLDVFDHDENLMREATVDGVSVDWRMDEEEAVAYFEYDGHRYFVKALDVTDEDYILALVGELIP